MEQEHVLSEPTKLEEETGKMVADEWIRTWQLPVLPFVWFGGKRRKDLGHQIAMTLATGRHMDRVEIREWLEKTCCRPKERP